MRTFLAYLLTCLACLGQSLDCNFPDATGSTTTKLHVTITPTTTPYVWNAGVIRGDAKDYDTLTNGTLHIAQLIGGTNAFYRMEIIGPKTKTVVNILMQTNNCNLSDPGVIVTGLGAPGIMAYSTTSSDGLYASRAQVTNIVNSLAQTAGTNSTVTTTNLTFVDKANGALSWYFASNNVLYYHTP